MNRRQKILENCFNKKIQKLLNKNIEDYKEKHFKIEIISIENQVIKFNFVNTLNKEQKSYFHIFFNDKIKIVIDEEINSLKGLFKIINFYGC